MQRRQKQYGLLLLVSVACLFWLPSKLQWESRTEATPLSPPLKGLYQQSSDWYKSYDELLEFYGQFRLAKLPECQATLDRRWPQDLSETTLQFRDLFRRYVTFHREQSTNRNSKDGSQPRILVASTVKESGIGNLNMVTASALVLAIMTQRVLVVEYDVDIQDIFCQFILPGVHQRSVTRSPKSLPWGELKYQQALEADIHEVTVNLNFYRGADTRTFFIRDEEFRMSHHVPVLRIESDQYFLPGLMLHPRFGPILTRLFPDHDAYRRIFQIALLPSDSVWHRTSQILSHFDFGQEFVVGVQVRMFHGYDVAFRETIEKCLQQEPGIIDLPLGASSKRLSVMVISLLREPKEDIKRLLVANNQPESTKVYQPSDDGKQAFASSNQLHAAYAESLALGFCDRVVVSSMSTLGYQALAVHPHTPFYLLAKGSSVHGPDRKCWSREDQLKHNDPCFHTPQMKYYVELGFAPERLGLRRCVDVADEGYSLT